MLGLFFRKLTKGPGCRMDSLWMVRVGDRGKSILMHFRQNIWALRLRQEEGKHSRGSMKCSLKVFIVQTCAPLELILY